MKNRNRSFGRMIVERRHALGIKQTVLARRIGVTVGYIRMIEADTRHPSRATAERLARELSIPDEEWVASFNTATEDHDPAHLRVPLPALIGRAGEVADVSRKLRHEVRLLTLTGEPGIGKTRLGLEVARRLVDQFDDDVFFVDLAAIGDPAFVVPTILQAIGVKEISGASPFEILKTHLRDKKMLLMLDNFDHVISAAPIIAAMLEIAPNLKILVTSREILHLKGERKVVVSHLALPDPKHLPPVEKLARYPAVEMFVYYANATKPTFALTQANASAVAEICVWLEGIPLAIELAAARIKLLTPQALLERLRSRLTEELRSRMVDHPPRHETPRAAISWSYELLNTAELALFARLGVFAGGCTLEAAEAVLGDDGQVSSAESAVYIPVNAVLDGLSSLIDKSLLRQVDEMDGKPRFVMLETIREFAQERLIQNEEAEAILRKHARYYLELAETASPEIEGPQGDEWLDHLESEYRNLHAALDWARDSNDTAILLRLCVALWRFWEVRGYLRVGRSWLKDALAPVSSSGSDMSDELPALRATVLRGAGALAYDQGDYDQAAAQFEESLALSRSIGDTKRIAEVLNDLGMIAGRQGDFKQAMVLYEESLALSRAARDGAGTATSLNNLGNIAHIQGDYDQATALFNQSLALRQTLGATRGMAWAKTNRGLVACDQGGYEQAVALFTESLTLFQELEDDLGVATSFTRLGRVARYQGDTHRATKLVQEGLSRLRELENKSGIAKALNILGDVARDLREFDRAAAAYNESLALFRDMQDKYGIAWSGSNVGDIALDQNDFSAATTLYKESLLLRQELGDKTGIAYVLEGFAGMAAKQRQPERAARLFGAAESLRESINAKLAPPERVIYDRYVAIAREQLDTATFDAASATGREMPLDQAIAYALEDD
jgi:predicted ATPase/Tfp pilus assembly protein PilF/DNA-binding XRE family transcriptional regulator